MKKCSDCKTKLTSKNSIKNKYNKDGIGNICKSCCSIRTALWQKNNKDKVAAKARRFALKKYNITETDYQSMLVSQNSVCRLCHGTNSNGQKLAVDHCHITGKVRGLLCFSCNSGIGNLGDSIELLQKAIDYLKSFKGISEKI